MSFVTMLPLPITTLLPTVTPGMMCTPPPVHTSFPTVMGASVLQPGVGTPSCSAFTDDMEALHDFAASMAARYSLEDGGAGLLEFAVAQLVACQAVAERPFVHCRDQEEHPYRPFG